MEVVHFMKNRVEDIIFSCLESSGLYYRCFSRVKNKDSIQRKIDKDINKYTAHSGKKIQDIIGFRIVVYFQEDISLTRSILSKYFDEISNEASISEKKVNTFEPQNYNIIYKIPSNILMSTHSQTTDSIISDELINNGYYFSDTTFEVQIRTVLSEGWHEVEHDLRYKFNSDWDNHDNEYRAFNGIFATLETAEWSMSQILEQLSFNHYKNKKLLPLIRTKLKLRIDNSKQLKPELEHYILSNKHVMKNILRLDRGDFIEKRILQRIKLPLTYDNIIFMINEYYINDLEIKKHAPRLL